MYIMYDGVLFPINKLSSINLPPLSFKLNLKLVIILDTIQVCAY